MCRPTGRGGIGGEKIEKNNRVSQQEEEKTVPELGMGRYNSLKNREKGRTGEFNTQKRNYGPGKCSSSKREFARELMILVQGKEMNEGLIGPSRAPGFGGSLKKRIKRIGEGQPRRGE